MKRRPEKMCSWFHVGCTASGWSCQHDLILFFSPINPQMEKTRSCRQFHPLMGAQEKILLAKPPCDLWIRSSVHDLWNPKPARNNMAGPTTAGKRRKRVCDFVVFLVFIFCFGAVMMRWFSFSVDLDSSLLCHICGESEG